MSKLMAIEWQTKILLDDFDVIELIACRGAGKTLLGLRWAEKDCDQLIVMTNNPVAMRQYIKEKEKEFKLELPPVKVISNLMQLQKIYTHPKLKTKILVDEYFALNITFNQIDKTMGHENYKIMFVGTRKQLDDNFKIPFSKQYTVDILRLANEGIVPPEMITDMLAEKFELDFMSPFTN